LLRVRFGDLWGTLKRLITHPVAANQNRDQRPPKGDLQAT
jgi:hypothetical protein